MCNGAGFFSIYIHINMSCSTFRVFQRQSTANVLFAKENQQILEATKSAATASSSMPNPTKLTCCSCCVLLATSLFSFFYYYFRYFFSFFLSILIETWWRSKRLQGKNEIFAVFSPFFAISNVATLCESIQ